MSAFRRLSDAGPLRGRRVLVRVDFNVPMQDGRVADDTRLRAALPTLRALSAAGARTALLSHFGRPKGRPVAEMSLKTLVKPLSDLLEQPVAFAADCVGPPAEAAIAGLEPGGVALLENLRFHAGEEADDPEFVAALAALGDLYVDDAFSAAHRAHASTHGLARRLPAYAGLAMERELEALEAALGSPRRPVLGVVGGSKVSTKMDLLRNLVARLDRLVIGGGMANTFLLSRGVEIGASMAEPNLAEAARDISRAAEAAGCELLLPVDVVVAEALERGAPAQTRPLGRISASEKIFDAGPETLERFKSAVRASRTLVWNGPLGVFEVPPFDRATLEAARFVADQVEQAGLTAVAGGGDTVAALHAAGVASRFSYVSTAGGAFLEWMEGKALPGVEALSA